jgi:hypothetical protein
MQHSPCQVPQHACLAVGLSAQIPDMNTTIGVCRAEVLLTGAEGEMDGLVGGDLPLQGVEDHDGQLTIAFCPNSPLVMWQVRDLPGLLTSVTFTSPFNPQYRVLQVLSSATEKACESLSSWQNQFTMRIILI